MIVKKIAIYLTDTWRDENNAQFDNYAQMFEDMFAPLVENATFTHFDVVNDEFPNDPTIYDAVIITGSSAFVTDDAAWIERLFEHIRIIDDAKVKLLGVCFGHQAIAVALGGKVEHKDVILGSEKFEIVEQQPWMTPWVNQLKIYAGNFQQVVMLPQDMSCIAGNDNCPIVMAVKQEHILSLQFHPELSAKYMHNYINHITNIMPFDKITRARSEIDGGSDADVLAKWAANFLTK